MVNLRIATLGLPKNGGDNSSEVFFEKFLVKLSPSSVTGVQKNKRMHFLEGKFSHKAFSKEKWQ